MFNKDSKTGKLFMALNSGEELTEDQIKLRFGLKNPRASVSDLRDQGITIYANRRKDEQGKSTTKYRIGKPSRELIAAGYRALRQGI